MTANDDLSTSPDEPNSAVAGLADADLILRTRAGDASAYGELWRRHYRSGITVARSITSSIDADDLVQEAYAKIYQTILRGGGPTASFRAYLLTSVRNAAASWGRARNDYNVEELESLVDPDSTEEAVDNALDQSLTTRAFRSLPTRWQEVLWYSEVEQLKPADISPLLGMSTGAVSQLAFRAREGLREAWIQAHLSTVTPDSDCQWAVERLGAHSRGNLGTRDQKRLEKHLDECSRCLIVAAEAKHVSGRLALVLLPLVLGAVGASGYAAALQSGSASTIALAAMPSAVMPGVVVAGVGSGVASGGGASASGSAGASGAGASGAGASGAASSTGVITGMGALVGVGATALVVAGAIVAAAVVPGLLPGPGSTSSPVAGQLGAAGIVTEVTPAEDAAVSEPLVLSPVVAPAPAPRANPATPTPSDVPASSNEQVVVPLPTEPPTEVAPVDPVDPGTEGPGTGEPGPGGPGVGEPGPGTGEPGPGTGEPGPGTGGPGEGGTEQPGGGEGGEGGETPIPPVTLPAGAPTISLVTATCESRISLPRYSIGFNGAPGATVEGLIDGSPKEKLRTVLDASGAGAVELHLSPSDWFWNRKIQFRYVTATEQGGLTEALRVRDLSEDDFCLGNALADESSSQQTEADTSGDANAADTATTNETTDTQVPASGRTGPEPTDLTTDSAAPTASSTEPATSPDASSPDAEQTVAEQTVVLAPELRLEEPATVLP